MHIFCAGITTTTTTTVPTTTEEPTTSFTTEAPMEACEDKKSEKYCNPLNKKCDDKVFRYFCKRTCDLCPNEEQGKFFKDNPSSSLSLVGLQTTG